MVALERYAIAKNEGEFDKMLHCSDIIEECQDDLVLLVICANQFNLHFIHYTHIANRANKNNDFRQG